MPLFSLPTECFSNVLSFLDSQCLYNSLFVNKYWCSLSIPILWKDPFESICMRPKLINTLLSCLNEEEISSLIPYAINVPNNQSPLFEYGKYIRKIRQTFVEQDIIYWLSIRYYPQDNRVQKLIDVIYHMIMRQGSNLQEFNIKLYQIDYIDLPKFSIFTTFRPGITNLRSLKMEKMEKMDVNLKYQDDLICQNAIEFLTMVPKFCNKIIDCEISVDNLNEIFINPFLNIIRSQPLERILIYISRLSNLGGNTQKILNSLEFRSDTLRELSFEHLNFQRIDLSFMTDLEFTEKIKFIHCKGFISEHCEALSKKKFQFKELKFWHDGFYNIYDMRYDKYSIELNIVKSIIGCFCGESLLKLSLNVITMDIINGIKEYCPNIFFLHILIVSPEPFRDPIIPLICDLSSLKILHIQTKSFIFDSGTLAKVLGDFLTSVEYLFFDFFIDLLSFQYFTKNCKANLKKWIVIPNDNSLRKDYLSCVNNYQKVHNSLKVLGINKLLTFGWTNEEIEIVDLLKNQGVEVVASEELKFLFDF
ncbi:unnamed protein product [Rhizophagus irregularis]|nr:unnamed protein product [Rhizophagus irregularis]CAB5322277.1 unnamed protein product [Rhizophagus irregularis]